MIRTWILGICCLLMIVCSGCSSVQQPDTVSYVLEAEPSRLDPAMTTNLAENNTELQLFEGLTRLDKDDVPQPALAASWDISPDGKVYTFHLRDGIRWSDGTPITAQDIEFSWKRVIDPDIASENAYMMFCIDNAENYFKKKARADEVGIRALDDKTLQVRLTNPTAYFLNLTAFHCYYPVPRRQVERGLLMRKRWYAAGRIKLSNGFTPAKLRWSKTTNTGIRMPYSFRLSCFLSAIPRQRG